MVTRHASIPRKKLSNNNKKHISWAVTKRYAGSCGALMPIFETEQYVTLHDLALQGLAMRRGDIPNLKEWIDHKDN